LTIRETERNGEGSYRKKKKKKQDRIGKKIPEAHWILKEAGGRTQLSEVFCVVKVGEEERQRRVLTVLVTRKENSTLQKRFFEAKEQFPNESTGGNRSKDIQGVDEAQDKRDENHAGLENAG